MKRRRMTGNVTLSAAEAAWLPSAGDSLPPFVHPEYRERVAASMARMYASVAGRRTIDAQHREANRWRCTGSGLRSARGRLRVGSFWGTGCEERGHRP